MLGLLFAIPASGMWIYLATQQGFRAPICSLAVGALCGLGVRKGGGDYFPAFLGTLILILSTISINTLVILAGDVEVSPLKILIDVVSRARITDFCNEAILMMGRRSFIAIPTSFYLAYKVLSRD